MLADHIKLSNRTAFEILQAEDAAVEVYRVTAHWYYIAVARCFDHWAEDVRVIHRRHIPGRFTTLHEAIDAMKATADSYDAELAAMLETERREAKAEDYLMRRNDPFDPLYWDER